MKYLNTFNLTLKKNYNILSSNYILTTIALCIVFSLNINAQTTVSSDPCNGGLTFQEAVDEVITNNTPNQTILIDPSLFTNNSPGGNWGLATLVGPAGNNLSGLTIDGQGSYIDATAAGLGFFEVSNMDNITIKNFTFDGFNRSTGSLVIDNCENMTVMNVIFANGSTTQPVVISAENGNTDVDFIDCEFSGNPSSSDSPTNTSNSGAIQISGDASNTLDVLFTNTKFRCNGRDGNGGAIQASGDLGAATRAVTTISFTNCDFETNNSTSSGVGGGAILAEENITVNVTDCNFAENSTTGGQSAGGGGAIMIFKASLNVAGSYFYNNNADGSSMDGGAIGCSGSSSDKSEVTISNSIFAFNECSDEGGAIFFRHTNATISNTLFLHNDAPDAGAIHIDNAGNYDFDNITITGTTGGSGKGIENVAGGTLSLDNSIVIDNSGTNVDGSLSGSNNTTSGTVTFASPMPGGTINPATYNYDVAGTQGATIGVLNDVSASTDCSVTSPEIIAPPMGVNPCDSYTSLPVELISFMVKEDDCNALLLWSTATEENTHYYSIEISNDGRAFHEIAQVEAVGNSTSTLNYSHTATNPRPSTIYRLRIVDFDGSYEYSETVLFNQYCNQSVILTSIYPNPSKNELNIHLTSITEKNININTIDVSGKMVSSINVMLQKGDNVFSLDNQKLSSGVYFISIEEELGRIENETIRFIKL